MLKTFLTNYTPFEAWSDYFVIHAALWALLTWLVVVVVTFTLLRIGDRSGDAPWVRARRAVRRGILIHLLLCFGILGTMGYQVYEERRGGIGADKPGQIAAPAFSAVTSGWETVSDTVAPTGTGTASSETRVTFVPVVSKWLIATVPLLLILFTNLYMFIRAARPNPSENFGL